jgi:sporulation protein YlmC with PRC-barrel domain
MELSEPFALSALIGLEVREFNGGRIGRVWEVRAHRDRDGSVVCDEILLRRGGLIGRLRGPRHEAPGIRWEAVAEIADDHIVVRA